MITVDSYTFNGIRMFGSLYFFEDNYISSQKERYYSDSRNDLVTRANCLPMFARIDYSLSPTLVLCTRSVQRGVFHSRAMFI